MVRVTVRLTVRVRVGVGVRFGQPAFEREAVEDDAFDERVVQGRRPRQSNRRGCGGGCGQGEERGSLHHAHDPEPDGHGLVPREEARKRLDAWVLPIDLDNTVAHQQPRTRRQPARMHRCDLALWLGRSSDAGAWCECGSTRGCSIGFEREG